MGLEPPSIFETAGLFYPFRASRDLFELLEKLAHWKNEVITCRAVEDSGETLDL